MFFTSCTSFSDSVESMGNVLHRIERDVKLLEIKNKMFVVLIEKLFLIFRCNLSHTRNNIIDRTYTYLSAYYTVKLE